MKHNEEARESRLKDFFGGIDFANLSEGFQTVGQVWLTGKSYSLLLNSNTELIRDCVRS